jgi:8-oxo-dGTP pyrophosphatase MutT (NUDIX family)
VAGGQTGLAAGLIFRAVRLGLKVARWNKGFLVGSVGFVVHESGAVLMACHRFRRVPWGPPGGLLERGEQPVGALVRELREELLWETEEKDWVLLDVRAANGFPLVEVAYVFHSVWAPHAPNFVLPGPVSSEVRALSWHWPRGTPVGQQGLDAETQILDRHRQLSLLALRHFGL